MYTAIWIRPYKFYPNVIFKLCICLSIHVSLHQTENFTAVYVYVYVCEEQLALLTLKKKNLLGLERGPLSLVSTN
jgi:hypothetical protein